jgi:hypothetical protein
VANNLESAVWPQDLVEERFNQVHAKVLPTEPRRELSRFLERT